MKIKVRLRPFFEREAKTLTREYKKLITTRKGVSLDKAPNNAAATIKQKGFNHWLVNTGETKNKGFRHKAHNKGFKVFANPAKHSGRYLYVKHKNGEPVETVIKRSKNSKATYEDIFDWNNQKNYSGVFEFLPVGSRMPQRLDKELAKQIQPQIANIVKKTITQFRGVRFV